MATENEKLCLAIVNNSTITNIKWAEVGEALGGLKPNSVQKRWKRFKDSSMAGDATNGQPAAKINGSNVNGKKRSVAEMDGGEEENARELPATTAAAKKVKTENRVKKETGRWAVKKEDLMYFDDFESAEA